MNLFAYGTLLVPKIWEAVTGAPQPRNEEATLSRHRIFKVSGEDFPAIVETGRMEEVVPGRVFFDLPLAVIHSLDQYEDSFYERIEVEVSTKSGSTIAQVYRIPRPKAGPVLSSETWTLEWFETEASDRYWARLFG